MRTLKTLAVLVIVVPALSSCASKNPPCEEIVEVNRQIRECEDLKKVMNNKSHPQQALTARKRYEEACVNLRYYRDEYDTICKKNERAIGERKD